MKKPMRISDVSKVIKKRFHWVLIIGLYLVFSLNLDPKTTGDILFFLFGGPKPDPTAPYNALTLVTI
jgi:hypothetical protein